MVVVDQVALDHRLVPHPAEVSVPLGHQYQQLDLDRRL